MRRISTSWSTARALVAPAFEDEARVDAAEREVVVHEVFHLELASFAGDVVQVRAGRIEVLQVDGGCEPAFAHHLDGQPGFQRAAGAEGVAEVALEGAQG